MKIFQIWIKGEPSEFNKKLMKHNQQFGEYTLISEENFLNADNWLNVKQYNFLFENIKFGNIDVIKSDILRFFYAAKEPMLYVDCDCKIFRLPEFENKSYFPEKDKLLFDYYVFYSGVPSLFKEISEKISLSPGPIEAFDRVNRKKAEISPIPRDCFKHYSTVN